jgi:hypothetical protein
MGAEKKAKVKQERAERLNKGIKKYGTVCVPGKLERKNVEKVVKSTAGAWVKGQQVKR